MIIWILVKIEDDGRTITVDPLGGYKDAKLAMSWIKKLEQLNIDPDSIIFDALEYEMDGDPISLPSMVKKYEDIGDQVSDTIKGLMDKGLIDQLIGEDGEFYYELTKKGKTTMRGVAGQLIQKFLDEKRNCDL